MKIIKSKGKIEIVSCEDFNITHIMECGQVFAYQKIDDVYYCFPKNKLCKVSKTQNGFLIECEDEKFFENYFDLKTDYSSLKKELSSFGELKNPISFGSGIRILKQDVLETIISFIVSANNNIKRITNTLLKLRQHFGKRIENSFGVEFFQFPTLSELLTLNEEFFKKIGAGYRASYLVSSIKFLSENENLFFGEEINKLETKELLENLLKLKGVGRKVAECILLFGYGRRDVFPVDTWIKKVFTEDLKIADVKDASKMCDILIKRYGNLSGYAQQYLFYSKRENG